MKLGSDANIEADSATWAGGAMFSFHLFEAKNRFAVWTFAINVSLAIAEFVFLKLEPSEESVSYG